MEAIEKRIQVNGSVFIFHRARSFLGIFGYANALSGRLTGRQRSDCRSDEKYSGKVTHGGRPDDFRGQSTS